VDAALLTAVCQAIPIEGLSLPASATPHQRQLARDGKHQLAVEVVLHQWLNLRRHALDVLHGRRR